MHKGLNRPDGRHWCAPDSTDGSENPLECGTCGRVWLLKGNTWSELPETQLEPSEEEV